VDAVSVWAVGRRVDSETEHLYVVVLQQRDVEELAVHRRQVAYHRVLVVHEQNALEQ
jgi:hypothetical protein